MFLAPLALLFLPPAVPSPLQPIFGQFYRFMHCPKTQADARVTFSELFASISFVYWTLAGGLPFRCRTQFET